MLPSSVGIVYPRSPVIRCVYSARTRKPAISAKRHAVAVAREQVIGAAIIDQLPGAAFVEFSLARQAGVDATDHPEATSAARLKQAPRARAARATCALAFRSNRR